MPIWCVHEEVAGVPPQDFHGTPGGAYPLMLHSTPRPRRETQRSGTTGTTAATTAPTLSLPLSLTLTLSLSLFCFLSLPLSLVSQVVMRSVLLGAQLNLHSLLPASQVYGLAGSGPVALETVKVFRSHSPKHTAEALTQLKKMTFSQRNFVRFFLYLTQIQQTAHCAHSTS